MWTTYFQNYGRATYKGYRESLSKYYDDNLKALNSEISVFFYGKVENSSVVKDLNVCNSYSTLWEVLLIE